MKHFEDDYDNFDDLDMSWMDKLDAVIDGDGIPLTPNQPDQRITTNKNCYVSPYA